MPAHPLHTGQGAVWSPDASIIAAQHRLDAVLAILRSEGLRAEGELGDYRPLHAMDDAVQKFKPDLIVISTHPEERSAWLRQDIVERARASTTSWSGTSSPALRWKSSAPDGERDGSLKAPYPSCFR